MTYAFPSRFVLPLIVTVLLTVDLTKPLIHPIGRKFLAAVFALLFLYFQSLIPPIDLSLIDIEPRRYLCRAVTVIKQLSAGFFEFYWIHIVSSPVLVNFTIRNIRIQHFRRTLAQCNRKYALRAILRASFLTIKGKTLPLYDNKRLIRTVRQVERSE